MLRLWRQFTVSLDLDANNKLNCKIWSLSNSSYLSCEAFAQKCAKVCAYAYLFNSLIHCFVFFVCLSLCVYIFLKFINSLIYFQCTFWAEAGIFHENKVNMIVADALTPSIIRSSAAMLLAMKDKLFLICHQASILTICLIQLLRNDGKCNVLVFLHNNSTRKSTKTAVDSCFTEINTHYMHHSHWTSENKFFSCDAPDLWGVITPLTSTAILTWQPKIRSCLLEDLVPTDSPWTAERSDPKHWINFNYSMDK